MRFSKPIFLSTLALCLSSSAIQAGDVVVNLPQKLAIYLRDIQKLQSAVTLDYQSQLEYNGKKQTVTGRMAVQGENYYDSSTARFAFRNADWLLVANHPTRHIKVVYIPKWKTQTGNKLELETNQFLFPELNPKYVKGLQATQLLRDTTCIRFQYSPPEPKQTLSLALYYAGTARFPSRYEGSLTVEPSKPENGSSTAIKMSFQCWHVTPSVSPSLFDVSRLIRVQGKDARLIRFTDYQAPRQHS